MTVLRPVTKENIDELLALSVRDDQKSFVSTVGDSLAQAYVYSETAYPFGIYDGETPVGFIMMAYYEAKDYYTLWKLLIDKDHQHRGFGRQALEQGIAFLKERFGAEEVYGRRARKYGGKEALRFCRVRFHGLVRKRHGGMAP